MGKKYIVRLTSEERKRLKTLVSKGVANARKICHARVLLKVDADGPNWADEKTGEAFSIRANTVRDIRQRFVEEGLDAALERKGRKEPPTPRKLDGAGEARLIALACGEPPEGAFPPEEARRIAEKLEIHHTPKHGSWLNVAEIELRVLTVQCLNRRIGDAATLRREVTAWEKARNESDANVDWQFRSSDARIHLKQLYPRIEA